MPQHTFFLSNFPVNANKTGPDKANTTENIVIS